MDDPQGFKAALLDCDVIICPVVDSMLEAQSALKMLSNSAFDTEKTFVLVSSVLTWHNTLLAQKMEEQAEKDAEKAAARTEMRKEGGGRHDRGDPGDGRIREEILKRFDKDGDGKLSDSERAEFKKARAERRENGGPGRPVGERMREEIIKRFDKDGDGKLNDAERAEAEQASDEKRQKRNGGQ